MDIKTAFLYGKRENPIYLRIPVGHPKRKEGYVWRTFTSVYALSDAPKVWYELLLKTLQEYGFKRCLSATCLFAKSGLIIIVYADDILYFAREKNVLLDLEVFMRKSFNIEETHKIENYVGFQVMLKENKLVTASHGKSAIKRFKLEERKGNNILLFMEVSQLSDKRLYQSII